MKNVFLGSVIFYIFLYICIGLHSARSQESVDIDILYSNAQKELSIGNKNVAQSISLRGLEISLNDSLTLYTLRFRKLLNEVYIMDKNFPKAIEQMIEIIHPLELKGDTGNFLSESYYLLGKTYIAMGAGEMANDYLQRAFTKYNEEDNIIGQAKTLQAQALNYHLIGSFKESIAIYTDIITSPKNFIANQDIKGAVYDGLLSVLIEFRDYEAAIRFGEKFRQENTGSGNPATAKIFTHLATAYLNSGKPQKALDVILRAAEIDTESNEILISIGESYIQNTLYRQGESTLQEALVKARLVKDEKSMVRIFTLLGKLKLLEKNINESIFYLRGAEKLAIQNKLDDSLEEVYEYFVEDFQVRGDAQEVSKYKSLLLTLPSKREMNLAAKKSSMINANKFALALDAQSRSKINLRLGVGNQQPIDSLSVVDQLALTNSSISSSTNLSGLKALENQQELELARKERLILQQQAQLQKTQLEASKQQQIWLLVTVSFSLIIILALTTLIIRAGKARQTIAKQNEDLLLQKRDLKHAQMELEKTLRLAQQTSRNLHRSNKFLKAAQTQLIHAEKMSSLGQLTAGIVHEINNPVNFVKGGIEILNKNLTQLLGLFQEISLKKEGMSMNKKSLEELQTELEEEVKFANEVIPQIVKDVLFGTSRISEIVNNLRIFSRQEEEAPVTKGLHELIDSALVILRTKYQPVAELIKKYDPKIKNIECFPGLLNQVIVNLVSNSVDAITGRGVITIETINAGERIAIKITDTGSGMDESVLEHIFEPFFTTKEVGKGTGLGLSITYSIIKKHGGSIKVKSKRGVGTTFTIELSKKLDVRLIKGQEIGTQNENMQ